MGTNNSGIQKSSQESGSPFTISRLLNRQSEIPPISSGDIRMAGPQMGPPIPYPLSHSEQKEVHSSIDETVSQEPIGLAESSGESIRGTSVCLSDRLPAKSQVEGHQHSLEEKSDKQAQGSTF